MNHAFVLLLLLLPALCAGGFFTGRHALTSGFNGTSQCLLANCSKQMTKCFGESACRSASTCNAKCALVDPSQAQSCNLLCELNYGYNSSAYKSLMNCMAEHDCLPQSPPDGKCLATKEQTLQNLTHMSQLEGRWWIVRGLNCGQPGWPAGFDYFPCQYDQFYPKPDGVNWEDKISYCGGTNSTCTTPYLYTYANVSISEPGVMHHIYTDPPLKPQVEDWLLLSWPHPDWMLYLYCGTVPTGSYAGGSVVTRTRPVPGTGRRASDIPAYVETIFRRVAQIYQFDYDAMCISDDTQCQN